MDNETIGEYLARASGSVGYEILDPDGEVVAWTTDRWWAATIVALLNGAEGRGAAALTDGETCLLTSR